VKVQVIRGQPGQLMVSVIATSGSGAPDNRIQALHFVATDGGSVDVNGAAAQTGEFSIIYPSYPQRVDFVVRRTGNRSSPTTIRFAVTDDCGDWSTFVGGGPAAF
jgi:hypothetical protein